MKREVKHKYFGNYEITIGVSMEEAHHIIEQYNGKELSKYKHGIPCTDATAIPYLLEDGRIIKTHVMDATIYSTLKGFMIGAGGSNKKLIQTTYPKKRIEYLLGSDKIYYYEIDEAEGERIQVLYEAEPKDHPRDTSVYKLHSGEVVEYQPIGNKFTIYQKDDYDKLSEMRAVFKEISINRRDMLGDYSYMNPWMRGRNPYGEKFPDHVDELAAQLPQLLPMPEKYMKYTRNSLPTIDKYLYRNMITDEFTDRVFLPLLAYIGKSYLKENDGEWKMRYDESLTTWTPDIYDGGFKEMCIPLLEEILDSTGGMWTPLAVVYNHRPR